MLLSLDAEKTFDSISWQFLSTTLRYCNFGHTIFYFLHNLHTRVSTSLTINGCPISPLLFDLALDPLLRHLHTWSSFSGIRVGTEEIWVSAFANDLLIVISNPRASPPGNLQEIESKGKLLGLSLNLDKSEGLMLTGLSKPLWSNQYHLNGNPTR